MINGLFIATGVILFVVFQLRNKIENDAINAFLVVAIMVAFIVGGAFSNG